MATDGMTAATVPAAAPPAATRPRTVTLGEVWSSEKIVDEADLSIDGSSAGPVALVWGEQSGTSSRHPALFERRAARWTSVVVPPTVQTIVGGTSDLTGRTLVVAIAGHDVVELLSTSSDGALTTRSLTLADPVTVADGPEITIVGTAAGALTVVGVATDGATRYAPAVQLLSLRPSFVCEGSQGLAVALDNGATHEVATFVGGRWTFTPIHRQPNACLDLAAGVLILESTTSPDGGVLADLVAGTKRTSEALPTAVVNLVSDTVAATARTQLVGGPNARAAANLFETADAVTWSRLSTPSTGPASELPVAVALDGSGNPSTVTVDGHGTWTYNVGHGRR